MISMIRRYIGYNGTRVGALDVPQMGTEPLVPIAKFRVDIGDQLSDQLSGLYVLICVDNFAFVKPSRQRANS